MPESRERERACPLCRLKYVYLLQASRAPIARPSFLQVPRVSPPLAPALFLVGLPPPLGQHVHSLPGPIYLQVRLVYSSFYVMNYVIIIIIINLREIIYSCLAT